jgi:uncharacterized damage-inducible protein DinB
MLPILEDYLERLQSLHAQVETAVDGLPIEALDWAPGDGMNSLGVLVTHLAGAQRYWIGEVLGSDNAGRDRDAEFLATGQDGETLSARLAGVLAHTRQVLQGLTYQDLQEGHYSTRDGHRFTGAWCLNHALGHTALHLGHIQITRQLWDQHRSPE